MQETVIVGDLHLTRQTSPAVAQDLAALLAAHRGARFVVDGDLFDLSADPHDVAHDQALASVLGAHAVARRAFAEHVDRGGALWLVSGNHDAELGDPERGGDLAAALGVSGEAARRVRATPWFFRAGALHLEHGHLYDPDNAPGHPLVDGAPSLGVHFVREFLAPTGAFAYLNANDRTPLELFLSAFRWYGARGPYVVFCYFRAALGALLQSGPLYAARAEPAEGARRVAAFAERVGIDPALAERVLAERAAATLESLAGTFTRLYLDRVAATLGLVGGAIAYASGARRTGGVLAAMGAAAMATSWSRGHDRYGGTVPARLADAAQRIASGTGAKLVVFGHTHVEAEDGAYANTGSFAFPRKAPGRPYLVVEGGDDAPRAVRRHWPPG